MVSRVAKNPVKISSGLEHQLTGNKLKIKGKNGELFIDIHDQVNIEFKEDAYHFSPKDSSIEANALSGTMRALVNNMVLGTSVGFERKLLLVGVGYRATLQGKVLDFSLGFSHPVKRELPEGITAELPSNTELVLKGADKQQLNEFAAKLRSIRPPEPYKGKGIRYSDEVIILKEGKKK